MRLSVNARPAYPGCSGIGYFAHHLVLALAETAGLDSLTAYCSPDSPLGNALSAYAHVRTVEVNCRDPLWDQLHLPWHLEANGSDVYLNVLPEAPVCKVGPAVVTVHDVAPLSCPELISPDFSRFFTETWERSRGAVDHVLTVSEFSKREIVKHLQLEEHKVSVVHQSVDSHFGVVTAEEASQTVAQLGISGPYLLYVGAIEPRKNVHGLVKAYAEFCTRTQHSCALVVVGRSRCPSYEVKRFIESCAPRGAVRHIEFVPDDRLFALFAGATAFVYIPLYEGFGRPALEALASGVPVIASSRASLPEVCGDAACLVDPEDVEGVGEAIARFVADADLRDEYRRRGQARAKSFTAERFGSEVYEVCRSVVEGRTC